MWHIIRKLHEKQGRMLNCCEDFIKRIKWCVWALDSPNEFEESLGKMLEEYDFTNNEYLCHIYEIWELWVHVYFKVLGVFWGRRQVLRVKTLCLVLFCFPTSAWWNFGSDLWTLWSHNAIMSTRLKMLFNIISRTEDVLWDWEACEKHLHSHELLCVPKTVIHHSDVLSSVGYH